MLVIKYVIRFFKDDKYLYSIHCDDDMMKELVSRAKERGETVKIIAYRKEDENEV